MKEIESQDFAIICQHFDRQWWLTTIYYYYKNYNTCAEERQVLYRVYKHNVLKQRQ